MPGDARPTRAAPPHHPDPARVRGHLPRPRLHGRRRPRGRDDALQLRRSQLPAGHPTRSPLQTLFLDDETVLRTETSPAQIRTMEAQEPPIYVVSLGRVYRRDTPDATHTPTFHQVEGLAVDEGITLGDLEGTLDYLARALFGENRRTRFVTRSLPVHGALHRGARLLPHLRRLGLSRLPSLRVDRGRRRGDGRPEPLRVRRATTPSDTRASRSAGGSSASQSCATGSRTSASSGATTRAFWSSSDARPALLASRVRHRGCDRERDR